MRIGKVPDGPTEFPLENFMGFDDFMLQRFIGNMSKISMRKRMVSNDVTSFAKFFGFFNGHHVRCPGIIKRVAEPIFEILEIALLLHFAKRGAEKVVGHESFAVFDRVAEVPDPTGFRIDNLPFFDGGLMEKIKKPTKPRKPLLQDGPDR